MSSATPEWEPQLLSPEQVSELESQQPDLRRHDIFDGLVEELFEISNPALPAAHPDYHGQLQQFRTDYKQTGQWVYYPWRQVAVRVLEAHDFALVRQARNRNLVTAEEQTKLNGATIGIIGLSVGSQVVAALTLGARYKRIKIADADVLSLSNMNRLRASITDIGLAKTTLAARAVYEADPYATVEVYDQGLNAENLEEFLDGLDIVVDEMDDVALKVRLRLAARAAKLPVVMVTDTGDNTLLDYEPFQLEPEREIFHGLLTKADTEQILAGGLSRPQWIKMSMKIIDATHATTRLLKSLPEMGRTIAGVPQLGSSAQQAGAIAAYVVRTVLIGEAVKPGKHVVPIEEIVLADYHLPETVSLRAQLLERVKAMLDGL